MYVLVNCINSSVQPIGGICRSGNSLDVIESVITSLEGG